MGKLKLLLKMVTSKPDIIFASFLMNNRTCEKFFRLSGATYIYGYPINGNSICYTTPLPYDKNKHEVLLNMELLTPFINFDINKIKIHFPVPIGQKKIVEKIMTSLSINKVVKIGMHCGSNWDMPQKRYPEKKFASLGDELIRNLNADIILCGGPEEKDIGETVNSLMKEDGINCMGRYALMTVAALIKEFDLFITNDSGLMHLAAGVGCPVIALFGPTSLKKNAPWGDPEITKIIKSNEPCSPCHIPGKMIDCDGSRCMNSIRVNDILKMAKKLLNSPKMKR